MYVLGQVLGDHDQQVVGSRVMWSALPSFTSQASIAHGFRAATVLCAALSLAGALAGTLIRTRPVDGDRAGPVPAALIEEAAP